MMGERKSRQDRLFYKFCLEGTSKNCRELPEDIV